MVKRAFSIGILVSLITEAAQAAVYASRRAAHVGGSDCVQEHDAEQVLPETRL